MNKSSRAIIAPTVGLSFAGVVFLLLTRGADSPPANGFWPSNDVAVNRSDADRAPAMPPPEPASRPQGGSTRLRAVTVTFDGGLLAVRADGAPLDEVLAEVTNSVGITFVGSDDARETVSINAGPGPIPQVLSALLAGANYGYAFLDVAGQSGGRGRVVMRSRASGRFRLRSRSVVARPLRLRSSPLVASLLAFPGVSGEWHRRRREMRGRRCLSSR